MNLKALPSIAAEHVLANNNIEHNRRLPHIEPDAMKILVKLWPRRTYRYTPSLSGIFRE
jgi:hypothetical protein